LRVQSRREEPIDFLAKPVLMIGGLMPISADFLQSKKEHRHSFMVMQALKADQLLKITEEIRDFEQVTATTGENFFFTKYWKA